MSAQLLPGFFDRHEVPHMFLFAPRAQIKLFLWHLGTFHDSFRRRCWAVPLDGCLYGLVDDVADRLGQPLGRIIHRGTLHPCPTGSFCNLMGLLRLGLVGLVAPGAPTRDQRIMRTPILGFCTSR